MSGRRQHPSRPALPAHPHHCTQNRLCVWHCVPEDGFFHVPTSTLEFTCASTHKQKHKEMLEYPSVTHCSICVHARHILLCGLPTELPQCFLAYGKPQTPRQQLQNIMMPTSLVTSFYSIIISSVLHCTPRGKMYYISDVMASIHGRLKRKPNLNTVCITNLLTSIFLYSLYKDTTP